MDLFLLRPTNEIDRQDQTGPWGSWWDCAFGFVVRAENEIDARVCASKKCGDEGAAAWIDPILSTCIVLTATGEPGILIQDYNAG